MEIIGLGVVAGNGSFPLFGGVEIYQEFSDNTIANTITPGDNTIGQFMCTIVSLPGVGAVTLVQASGQYIEVHNVSAFALTLNCHGTDLIGLIGGVASIVLAPGGSFIAHGFGPVALVDGLRHWVR